MMYCDYYFVVFFWTAEKERKKRKREGRRVIEVERVYEFVFVSLK